MINPETLPCSIEQLFNLPPPPAPALIAVKPMLNKPNTGIASSSILVDPVIAPIIAPKINLPLKGVAAEPTMPVNKVGNGLSTGFWIVIAGGTVIVLCFYLANRLRHNKEKKKENDPANSI